MAFSSGKSSVSLEDILNRVTEANILSFYLGITEIPCIINSPLRQDRRPSFGLYSNDGKRIYYTDLSTRDRGGLFDLLGKMWNCSYLEVLTRIDKDIPKFTGSTNILNYSPCNVRSTNSYNKDTDLQCKVREWKEHDIEYWSSYGISLKWLKYAEVYPISHKIVIKNSQRYVFGADKYAYVYVEHKEGKVTLKIYQPFNKEGYKWSNKHDTSVISLWTKVPEYGDSICICASLKDALCLWANTGIPSLAIQGEGYRMSDTAIKELKRRYKQVFICLDNDEPGIQDARKLSEETGFTNVVLPVFEGGKDIADLYKLKGKEEFVKIIKPLFTSSRQEYDWSDLPFV
jgi:hypothetical protein